MRNRLRLSVPLAGLLGFSAGLAKGALVVDEHFHYTSTSAFHASVWNFDNNAGGEPLADITISSGSLSKSGLIASVGNKLYLTEEFEAAGIDFPEHSSLYASTLVNFDDLGDLDASGVLLFYLAQSGVSAAAGVHARLNGANIDFGVSKSDGSVTWTSGAGYDTCETLFVVFNYASIAGSNNDEARVWVYRASETDPAWGSEIPSAPTILTVTGGPDRVINGFSFHWSPSHLNHPSYYFDELRIGTTWADVTPVPEPAALLFLGIAAGFFAACRQGIRHRKMQTQIPNGERRKLLGLC